MKGKLLVILLVIVTLAALTLADLTFMSYRKEKSQRIAIKQELDDALNKKKLAENKLADLEKEASLMLAKLNDSDSQIMALTNDLDNEKKARIQAADELQSTRTELESSIAIKKDLEAKFNQAQKELKQLQDKLQALENIKAQLESKIKDLGASAEVKLDNIVVSGSKQVEATQGLAGQILVINRDYNFIVVNLGYNEGIAIGDIFSIYKENRLLAEATVEEVRPTISVATISNPAIKNQLKEGDKVIKAQ
jgi:predicted RNase H-like nuclease (RuvC/YqgF family)